MVVSQYPYSLEVLIENEAGFDEATGTFTDADIEWVDFGKCRDEIGNGSKITNPDGSDYVYSAVIYCPKTVNPINLGAKIRVKDKDGNIRVSKEIARFSQDQLHTRIWL